jgi:exodeoxyribonuclease VII small subunit
MNSVTEKVKSLSFEAALLELENVVRKLETGKEQLDTAVTDYEYGMILKKHCEQKLSEAKLRVEKIVKNEDGTITMEGE